MKEARGNSCFYFMISFLWIFYSDKINTKQSISTLVNQKKTKSSRKESFRKVKKVKGLLVIVVFLLTLTIAQYITF